VTPLRRCPLSREVKEIGDICTQANIFGFLKDFTLKFKGSFVWFMTVCKKQILAVAIRIQKENWE